MECRIDYQSLNENTASPKVGRKYPYLSISTVSDALRVIIPILEEGDLPVLCEYNGVTRRLACIDSSALNIQKLLKVTPLTYVTAPDKSIELHTGQDILEAGIC